MSEEIKRGDVVSRWHNTGAFGMQLVYGEVARVNRVTYTVRWEYGNTWRIDKHRVTLVTGWEEIEAREMISKRERWVETIADPPYSTGGMFRNG